MINRHSHLSAIICAGPMVADNRGFTVHYSTYCACTATNCLYCESHADVADCEEGVGQVEHGCPQSRIAHDEDGPEEGSGPRPELTHLPYPSPSSTHTGCHRRQRLPIVVPATINSQHALKLIIIYEKLEDCVQYCE